MESSNTRELSSLLTRVRRCKLCQHDIPEPRPLLQVARRASILIAGQAPGKKTHDKGIPFLDASGERLREWMGIDETVFYDPEKIAILPMAFCFPGHGKSGDLPPPKRCAENWREPLLDQLEGIRLKLIIGQYAQNWHLGSHSGKNLTETVKNWKQFKKGIFPLPHPSPRNNRWISKNPWFANELLPELRKKVASALGKK